MATSPTGGISWTFGGGGGGSAGFINNGADVTVATYADLPAAAANDDKLAWVLTTTGVWPLKKYSGWYVSTGGAWVYADIPSVIPPGGARGQILRKASATDYDLEWFTPNWDEIGTF